MPRTRGIAAGVIALLASALTLAAAEAPAELRRAVAAAEKARATPKGQEYQEAFSRAIREPLSSAMRDCIPRDALALRNASFQCVLIIGKTGKPKWIIRDSRDPMAQCFYAKLVVLTYPVPPADNWPVRFGMANSR